MQCPHCNAILPDGSKFCTVCGQNIGQPAAEMGATYTPGEFTEVTQESPYVPTENPKPKGKLKKLLTVLISLVVIAGVVAVVGLLTNWFGMVGPVQQIATAASNTAKAKSFTVTVEYSREYPEYDSHWDSRTDTYINEYLGMKTVNTTGTYYVVIDHDQEEIMMYGTVESDDGSEEEVAIYKDYYIWYEKTPTENGRFEESYDYYSYAGTIDSFFAQLKMPKKLKKELKKGEVDYEKVVDIITNGEVEYKEAKQYVDFDDAKDCAVKIWKTVNKRTWLKKNLDYSTKNEGGVKLHTICIENADFAVELLEMARPAFADKAEYRSIMEDLEEEYDSDTEQYTELTIGVKNNKIALYELLREYTYEDGKKSTYEKTYEFSNYNKTKVDEDDLEDLLEEAKKYEEKHKSEYEDNYYGY